MRTNNSKYLQTPASVNVTTPDGSKVVWGFMFENTLFTEFERRNHPIIEAAYRQRKKKHTSYYITITDSNLPKPGKAKVYFGVAQNHLRMPGTRYYVKRQVIQPANTDPSPRPPIPVIVPPAPVSSPYPLSALIPSPTSTFSSSSFSSLDTSLLYPTAHTLAYPNQKETNGSAFANNFTDDLPIIDFGNYPIIYNESMSSYFNTQYDSCNVSGNLGTPITSNSRVPEVNRNCYDNGFIPANDAAQCICNCHISDFNNAAESQNWIKELFSLGLLP